VIRQVRTRYTKNKTLAGALTMTTPLDPIISEFETQEQADAYDRWFRAKVEASLANTGPGVPHDEVMALAKKVIEDAERRRRERG
jgi:hypothetical protein